MVADRVMTRTERWLAGHLAPHFTSIARWMDQAPYGPPLGAADAFGMRY
jgi:hypothetical protein